MSDATLSAYLAVKVTPAVMQAIRELAATLGERQSVTIRRLLETGLEDARR